MKALENLKTFCEEVEHGQFQLTVEAIDTLGNDLVEAACVREGYARLAWRAGVYLLVEGGNDGDIYTRFGYAAVANALQFSLADGTFPLGLGFITEGFLPDGGLETLVRHPRIQQALATCSEMKVTLSLQSFRTTPRAIECCKALLDHAHTLHIPLAIHLQIVACLLLSAAGKAEKEQATLILLNFLTKVAIKFLLTIDSSPESLVIERSNLEREGKLLAKLNHPNIGTVYNTTTEPPGLVLAWIDSGPLSLTAYAYDDFQDMPPRMVVTIASQLCSALAYIHELTQPIIHRDIKPNNILLNEQQRPILIDFDIARSFQHDTVSQDKSGVYRYVGNELYSSPEQFTTPGSVSTKADIFSLGVVFYQLLTHRLPFSSDNNPDNYEDRRLPPLEQEDIPEPLFAIVREMLSQQPELRPTASALQQRFTEYLATLSEESY